MKNASQGKADLGGVFLRKFDYAKAALAGFSAGAVTGIFGAGGGMVLVPLLTMLTNLEEAKVFPTSVSIILPICAVTLFMETTFGMVDYGVALPYLLGSAIGGIFAGTFGHKVPTKWLHRLLGAFILWGGVRYLC